MKRFIETKLLATFGIVARVVVTSSVTFIAVVLVLLVTSCQKNPTDGDSGCPPLRPPIALSPYSDPIWSPDRKTIAFNHTPLKRIYYDPGDCLFYYEFYNDSTGFWMINADGSHKRRVLPYCLGDPDWNSDGQWIVFEEGAQIYKMRFSGNDFDPTTLTQLTFEGRNFLPVWSPDGQWIAYSNTIGDTVGVWISPTDGSRVKRYFAFGGEPDWFPDGQKLAYGNRGIWIETIDHSYKIQIYSDSTNRLGSIRVSPDGTKIAFLLQKGNGGLVQIYLMNDDGTNITQLTTEGVGSRFSWSPDGREIVYVSYRFIDYTFANGAIWVLNLETKEKWQLTFNNPPAPAYKELP